MDEKGLPNKANFVQPTGNQRVTASFQCGGTVGKAGPYGSLPRNADTRRGPPSKGGGPKGPQQGNYGLSVERRYRATKLPNKANSS